MDRTVWYDPSAWGTAQRTERWSSCSTSWGVDVSGIPGVGEPDAAPGVDGKVVGGVQRHAVQVVSDGYHAAIGVEADDSAAILAAAEQAALRVEGQTVGAVGVFAEHRELAGLWVVGIDPAGVDVGEQDDFAVPGGAFGDAAGRVFKTVEEAETPRHIGQLLEQTAGECAAGIQWAGGVAGIVAGGNDGRQFNSAERLSELKDHNVGGHNIGVSRQSGW